MKMTNAMQLSQSVDTAVTGYFIPIMFSVFAPNAKLATETVKDFPRIKRGAKDCILAEQ